MKLPYTKIMSLLVIASTILGACSALPTAAPTAIPTMPVETVIPTPTPSQQPTPAPSPTNTEVPPTVTALPCLDEMKFILNVTLDDNGMKNPPYIQPGAGFVKTWRVQNTGTCTWTPNYRLVYTNGNAEAARMNGQPVNLPATIIPGQSVDLSVTLIAPTNQSTYQGFWQMENINGVRFGPVVWVGITTQKVIVLPVATTLPTVNTCVLLSTTPTKSIRVRAAFDAVWTIKNVSDEDWDLSAVDYNFVSGTEMHDKASYDLAQTIKAGESGKIIVDMTAPAKPGTYSEKWELVIKKKILCVMVVTVTVIPK